MVYIVGVRVWNQQDQLDVYEEFHTDMLPHTTLEDVRQLVRPLIYRGLVQDRQVQLRFWTVDGECFVYDNDAELEEIETLELFGRISWFEVKRQPDPPPAPMNLVPFHIYYGDGYREVYANVSPFRSLEDVRVFMRPLLYLEVVQEGGVELHFLTLDNFLAYNNEDDLGENETSELFLRTILINVLRQPPAPPAPEDDPPAPPDDDPPAPPDDAPPDDLPAPDPLGEPEVDQLPEPEVFNPSSPVNITQGRNKGVVGRVGPLPQNHLEFTVLLEESSVKRSGSSSSNGSPSETDRKRSKRSYQSKTFKVEINFAAKIPTKSIALALKGNEAESTGDALRVLDIILRQQAAQRGCLLVRQSFFHDDVRSFVDVGGGVTACRGFHTTQSGLSLNMDVSSTMILTSGPVLEFLLINQNVRDPRQIDWLRAKKMLKNLRIKTRHSKMEFKIIGLSDQPCNKQYFPMKIRKGNGEEQPVEVTVYDYFTRHKNIELFHSAFMPCLDVAKPKRPNYLPLELCSLVSLQRYTKSLSTAQRSSLVEKSRQKPQERITTLTDALRNYCYDEDPMLAACGISIEKQLTQVDGRVLDAPSLKVGQGQDCIPRNGRWNFNNKRLYEPMKKNSACCDMSHLSRELINCGKNKGIEIERPFTLIEEDQQWRRSGPVVRVDKMFEQIKLKLPGPPKFFLCALPERKNSDIYGPWKKKNLSEMGICTQCISPTRINDQYLTNVLLKINTKLGGVNSLLAVESSPSILLISRNPTMILGMDVSHGSPGHSDIPSIAAVVGSRAWPYISRYRAAVRTQSPKVEMIDSLFKVLPNGQDDGIMRELLVDFFQSTNGRKPTQMIIFRDGVSESQFNQVLNIEWEQIIKALKHLGETDLPKFTVIVAQKNHHTKLFQAGARPENVPPGTVVDTKVVHPRNYDFYMCAQAGMIGTSRPAHYHVLLDEIGFTADDLQKLVHSLSYVNQHSTTAISIVAPICYAHHAASQVGQFIKFDDFSETSSGDRAITAAGPVPVQQLPRLHKNVGSSMFFC